MEPPKSFHPGSHFYESSLEDLTPEQQLLLKCSRRQEPQGEENDSKKQEASNAQHNSSEGTVGTLSNNNSSIKASSVGNQRNSGGNSSLDSNSHSAYNTLIIHQNNSSLLADTWLPASHEFTSVMMGYGKGKKTGSPSKDTIDEASPNDTELKESTIASNELVDIPKDYLNQLTVLKHLAKEVQQDPYTASSNHSLLRSASFSRSQPDLSLLPCSPSHNDGSSRIDRNLRNHDDAEKLGQPQDSSNKDKEEHFSEDMFPSVQMMEILMRENSNLKAELANARRKISTINKLEAELTRLQQQHAALFESTEKRESLERTARAKLSSELMRLTAVNRELLSSCNSLQNLNASTGASDNETFRLELAKKDHIITQLLTQNKELSALKDRQIVELNAQSSTLNEQRSHIDMLDKALENAQAKITKLEEKGPNSNAHNADQVFQLQQALSAIQFTSQKREESEKKARAQLEAEISQLRRQMSLAKCQSSEQLSTLGQSQTNLNLRPVCPSELQLLQEKLKASEDKIRSLNSIVIQWEKYFGSLNQSDKQSVCAAVSSAPNTPNSFSSSRGGTPLFFGSSGNSSGGGTPGSCSDDLPATQNRAYDLEYKIKDLENRLIERDAIINSLNTQRASPPPSYLSGSSPVSVLPNYRESPRYSIAAGLKPAPANSNVLQCAYPSNSLFTSGSAVDPGLFYSKVAKCESEPPPNYNTHMRRLGGSGSSLTKNSNENLAAANLNPLLSPASASNFALSSSSTVVPSVPSTCTYFSSDHCKPLHSQDIDEKLKEIDQQLLSKEIPSLKMHSGLCCIPGLSNTGAAARKGKISQSFLESVSRNPSSYDKNEGIGDSKSHSTFGSKAPFLPPLPKPNGSQLNSQSASRTSSGPPFISATLNQPDYQGVSTLSNSVDSILSENAGKINCSPHSEPAGACAVFTPPTPTSLPKGLPPRGPSTLESNKCRSLERDKQAQSNSCGYTSGKYTALPYDSSRCRSLDRKELKTQKQEEKETKATRDDKKSKSSVGSKTAFFGGLLGKRSPSPVRKKDKEKPVNAAEAKTSGKSGKFTFTKGISTSQNCVSNVNSKDLNHTPNNDTENDAETAFLDMQGRTSQRTRVSKWGRSPLEPVQEGSSADFSCNASPGLLKRPVGAMAAAYAEEALSNNPIKYGQNSINSRPESPSKDKKWGKIVKTPFGLMYTLGNNNQSGSQNSTSPFRHLK